MTTSNFQRLSEGLRLYRDAMRPFIVQRLQTYHSKAHWVEKGIYAALTPSQIDNVKRAVQQRGQAGVLSGGQHGEAELLDIHLFGKVIRFNWAAFSIKLKQQPVLTWIEEIGNERNTWAHPPAGDLEAKDVDRVLDSCERVLNYVDAAVAKQIDALRTPTAQPVAVAGASAPTAATPATVAAALAPTAPVAAVVAPSAPPPAPPRPAPVHAPVTAEGSASSGTVAVKGLPAWRTVVHPHPDVQAGRYQQAEFAADLAQVLDGKAEPEYGDAVEFFRRTFLTGGMRGLLQAATERLRGEGGEPVIQLKTSFGGGKTHTMLALYHLVGSGPKVAGMDGLRELLHGGPVPEAAIAVLVGTALDPAKPSRECAALQAPVNTLWGEMAYQLGRTRPGLASDADREQSAGEALRIVLESDAKGSAPGSNTLVQLFAHIGPCVVLVDELVAFMRNIREARGLPAGSFNSNMTFVQNLTEAVKRSPRAVLVVSIPESAIELGDSRGEEIARRIENTFGRLEAVWQPVAAHEGFEVVRRRLFGQVQDEGGREAVCRAFTDFYRNNANDFPIESREGAYYARMVASYPIHPEMFARLYEDWSTLERFQRTRGVLRLMASAIHELWRTNDQSPLIMPASLPLGASRVRNELTRYLSEQWNSVVDQDVDGDGAEPLRIDGDNPRFGALCAARRLARTIFLGSVPNKSTRGIEEVRIRLGAVQANEGIAVYNDALGRLRDRLSHLYTSLGVEGGRAQGTYWYAVQTNLNRTVADRQSKVDDGEAYAHLEKLLRAVKSTGGFAGVHVAPASSADVPDEDRARLVLLSPRHSHTGKTDTRDTPALREAQAILDRRGASPRMKRNMLLFLAPGDEAASSALAEAKRCLAWQSIVGDAEVLSLDAAQRKQAVLAAAKAAESVAAKLDEAYKWVLVPVQEGTAPQGWEVLQPQNGSLGKTPVDRASFAVETNELLIGEWGAYLLRRELDRYLWADGRPHLGVKQLWEYLTQYLYLPRLRDRGVILKTIAAGCRSTDFFGYAEGVDEAGRYIGLSFGAPAAGVYADEQSVIVRAEVAQRQLDAAKPAPPPVVTTGGPVEPAAVCEPSAVYGKKPSGALAAPAAPPKREQRRYYGAVQLDNLSLAGSSRQVFEAVVQHLTGLAGANVKVTLEIEADVPDGVPEQVLRTVTENARTLKFHSSDFDE